MIWDVHKDALLFKIKPKELADTRRKVISLTASIFDPIGFLAPFIVRAKIFLQLLWKLHQGWDEKVPEEIQQEWSVWQKELQSLAEFSVPQFYRLVMVSSTSIQLHLFGDASEKAFCTVTYFRFEYPSGERQCAFVAAKTHVASVKPLSIPRLELQAAVLSVRLACMIQKEHDYEVSSTIIGVTAVLLLVRFMESQSDILLSLPTGFRKSLILQSRSNGVTVLVNLTLQMMAVVA